MSAPSDTGGPGEFGMVVTPRPSDQSGVVVHHCPSAARRDDRAIAWLTPFETNTAAWPRVSAASGEKVVGEVPAVMPR
ncbi:MAG: hypothetical protein WEB59_13080 [Thermoanaerobaculia bacterium]